MSGWHDSIGEFLSQKRIAVAGVSRSGKAPGNAIYRRLLRSGYEVFAVNPLATELEGDTCYPDLRSIPGGVDGVIITSPPSTALQIVRECAELGIPRVWLHRSFGQGSVSQEAVAFCLKRGIRVVARGCPLMYCGPVDPFHGIMRWILGFIGELPREAPVPGKHRSEGRPFRRRRERF